LNIEQGTLNNEVRMNYFLKWSTLFKEFQRSQVISLVSKFYFLKYNRPTIAVLALFFAHLAVNATSGFFKH